MPQADPTYALSHIIGQTIETALAPLLERQTAIDTQLQALSAESLSDAVIETVDAATAPLRERIAALVALVDTMKGLPDAIAQLRERAAALETRAPVPGPRGPAGQDGVDGVGFDDLGFAHDGERGFVLRFSRGAVVKEFPFAIPGLPIYRTTYAAGQTYTAGDVVTYGNQAWIAKTTTISKPGEGSAWQLAVRKGADGKDGRPGERGPAGPAGKDWEQVYDAQHGRRG